MADNDAILLAQFEKACHESQNPATRAAAEEFLLNFRKAPNVLQLCQSILDKAASPIVQFYAAQALKDSVGRQYSQHSAQVLEALQNALISFVLAKSSGGLPHFVREQVLASVAVIVKRGWLDHSNEQRSVIFQKITELLHGSPTHQQVAISLISALLDEFTSSKASAVGLTWDFHRQCLEIWESLYLKPAFDLLIQVITAFSVTAGSSQGNYSLIVQTVATLEKIFNWDFISGSKDALAGSFTKKSSTDDDSNALSFTMFPPSWRESLIRPEIVKLFFQLHGTFLNDQTLGHRTRQCLISVVGVGASPNIFQSDEEKLGFVTHLVEGIGMMLEGLKSQSPSSQIIHGIAVLLHRLISTYGLVTLTRLPTFAPLLTHMHSLTLTLLTTIKSFTADLEVDDTWTMDALDELLESWTVVIGQLHQVSPDVVSFVSERAVSTFNAYVETRMTLAKQGLDDYDSDDEQLGIKDHQTYADQLAFIAVLGRCNPSQTVGNLNALLRERLEMNVQLIGSVDRENALPLLYEQIHWLIIIAGYLIADAGDSETPLIPNEIIPQSQYIVSLTADILKYLQFTCTVKSHEHLSPLVIEDLFWFLERWSMSYLFPSQSEYRHRELPLPVFEAYGNNASGAQVINLLLSATRRSFELLSGERETLVAVVGFLKSCAKNKDLEMHILHTEEFNQLLTFLLESLQHLPESIHKPVVSTLTSIISNSPDPNLRNAMLQTTMSRIGHRFNTVVRQDPKVFEKVYQRPEMINAVMGCLEMFTGLVSACTFSTASLIMAFVGPFLMDLVMILKVFRSVTEVEVFVLEFFASLVKTMPFDLLSQTDRQNIYFAIFCLLKQYAENNVGKKRNRNIELDDEVFEDLCLVLEIVTELIMDVVEVDNGIDEKLLDNSGDVGDVVFFGVNNVLPLINAEMLEHPRLCRYYILLVARLFSHFPKKLSTLPQSLVESLLKSLEFGINNSLIEVARDAFEAICDMSRWVRRQDTTAPNTTQFYTPLISHLLQIILSLMLYKDFDSDLVESAGESLLELVITRPQQYADLVHRIIADTDESGRDKARDAFRELEEPLNQVVGVVELRGANGVSKIWWREWDTKLCRFLVRARGAVRVI